MNLIPPQGRGMREHLAAAVSRTRREVGWDLAPPATPGELWLVAEACRSRGTDPSVPGGSRRPVAEAAAAGCADAQAQSRDLRALGEVLDAARRFARTSLVTPPEPLVYHLAATILELGYPHDRAMDVDAAVMPLAVRLRCSDAVAVAHLRAVPSASLKHMHPAHGEALARNIVREVSTRCPENQYGGSAPEGRRERAWGDLTLVRAMDRRKPPRC